MRRQTHSSSQNRSASRPAFSRSPFFSETAREDLFSTRTRKPQFGFLGFVVRYTFNSSVQSPALVFVWTEALLTPGFPKANTRELVVLIPPQLIRFPPHPPRYASLRLSLLVALNNINTPNLWSKQPQIISDFVSK